MFNEYFKNPSAASNPIFAATLPPPNIVRESASSSSSTSIDKDAPSPSTSPNIKTTTSPLNSINVKPNEKVSKFDSDTFSNLFAPSDTSSAKSSSMIVDTLNMHTFQQPPIYTKRWTTKKEPNNYKEAMEESCWIEAMQEEIHEFERLEIKLDEDPNGTLRDPTYYREMVESLMNKHIADRYHFIKEQVENKVVELYFIKTDYQLADIFTKALARERFKFLIKRVGMQSITPKELKHLAELDKE
uniref:Retrovirus-related Pol polyprotein from transposon TNT 1-94 n=1 Tax=Tanacetum cinerariifolium TaxID=118510 RepID=A0A699GMA7_TANCI|nr:retrovirus-related Pol polyprotein from transposon TNT 1-94 [Tanacetum cinerariifolium]